MNFIKHTASIHTKSFKGINVKKKNSVIILLMRICHTDIRLELLRSSARKLKGTG